MNARRGRRSRAGLTLIEVMLALAILGVGLSVLVASAGRAMSVVKQVRHFTTARHLLDILDWSSPSKTSRRSWDDRKRRIRVAQ
jgi:prepilin-type N-terminal cleavage/methylation domain-containing protein